MKLRKHKGNKHYKITWSQRTPRVVESHLNSDSTVRKVVIEGELVPKRPVYTTGQNPTATLNAFLFGRDRYNITARIEECAAPEDRLVETVQPPRSHPIVGARTGRRSPRLTLSLMAAVAGLSMGGFR